MSDRLIVQQNLPTVDVTLEDGSVVKGVHLLGELTVITQQTVVEATPIITAGAYSSGDALGGLLTFENVVEADGDGFTIDGLVIVDKGKQDANIDLVLFDDTFTATADNAAFDPSDADLLKCLGYLASGSYSDFADNSVMRRSGIGFNGILVGTSLYGQMVVRGTPTYTSTGDITVRLYIRRD